MKQEINRIIQNLQPVLQKYQDRILFAYLHGSVLSSENPRDIDVAVYLFPDLFDRLRRNGEVSLSFAIPMEMDLEKQLKKKVDVQVLNRAPLGFRYRVVTEGILIVDKDSNTRCDFESLSRVLYYDFRQKREEYLREVMT